MKPQRYLSHGLVAVAAWTAGGLCGYGFAPGPRASAGTAPVAASSPAGEAPKAADVVAPTAPAPVAAAQPIPAKEPAAAPLIPTAETVTLPIAPDSFVSGVEAFRLDVPKGFPIVVVRAMDEDSVWYVQDECERAEGSLFTCSAVFGNASTTPGMKFEMVALVAATAKEAEQFKPGTILRELPAGMMASPTIKVCRQ